MAPDVELNSSSYRLDPRFQGSLVDVLAYPIKGPCCCFLIHSPECPLASRRVSQRRPKVTFWTQLRVGANGLLVISCRVHSHDRRGVPRSG
jgi:hypothetical protein